MDCFNAFLWKLQTSNNLRWKFRWRGRNNLRGNRNMPILSLSRCYIRLQEIGEQFYIVPRQRDGGMLNNNVASEEWVSLTEHNLKVPGACIELYIVCVPIQKILISLKLNSGLLWLFRFQFIHAL